ncbi:MAG: DUF2721 domain-containing protein [Methylophilaceae bacterium]
MQTAVNVINIASVIQQAVAPVFLLTGVSAILGVLAGRLARVIDRFRLLKESGCDTQDTRYTEMQKLQRRAHWIHWAISLCTISLLLVCLVIGTLFVGVEMSMNPFHLVSLLFISAMLSLIAGLLCFLREISLATTVIEMPESLKNL